MPALVDPGLFRAFVGLAADKRARDRATRRANLYGQLGEAGERVGGAFIERNRRDRTEAEYEEAKKKGPEAVRDWAIRQDLKAGRQVSYDLLVEGGLAPSRSADQKDEARKSGERETLYSQIGQTVRGAIAQGGQYIRERARGRESMDRTKVQQDAATERTRLGTEAADRRAKSSADAVATRQAEARAHAAKLKDDQRQRNVELYQPVAERFAGQAAAAGDDVERGLLADIVARAQGGIDPMPAIVALSTHRERQRKAGVPPKAARVPASQVNSAAARETINKTVGSLGAKPSPEARAKAMELEQKTVHQVLNTPNPDGTPRTAIDVYDAYDDLSSFQPESREILLRRAQQLDAAELARADQVLADVDAALEAGDPQRLRETMALHGVTDADLPALEGERERRQSWSSIRILRPGDKGWDVKAAKEGREFQYLNARGTNLATTINRARRHGYTGAWPPNNRR